MRRMCGMLSGEGKEISSETDILALFLIPTPNAFFFSFFFFNFKRVKKTPDFFLTFIVRIEFYLF